MVRRRGKTDGQKAGQRSKRKSTVSPTLGMLEEERDEEAIGALRQDFCQYLVSARERSGKTLDEIATKTRIPRRSLERLETGEFESLPADVFVRGFIRSYARCVGLPEAEAIKRYSSCGMTPAPVASAMADELASAMATLESSAGPQLKAVPMQKRSAEAPEEPSRQSSRQLRAGQVPGQVPGQVNAEARDEAPPSVTRAASESVRPSRAESALDAPSERDGERDDGHANTRGDSESQPRAASEPAEPVAELRRQPTPSSSGASANKSRNARRRARKRNKKRGKGNDAAHSVDRRSSKASGKHPGSSDQPSPVEAEAHSNQATSNQTTSGAASEPVQTGDARQPHVMTSSGTQAEPRAASVRPSLVPSLVIDDADPEQAERERVDRTSDRDDTPSKNFIPPSLLDSEQGSRRGALTLAVIILVIVATLTMSYLMRQPDESGDGVTRNEPTVKLPLMG